jgi:hypothetical protein
MLCSSYNLALEFNLNSESALQSYTEAPQLFTNCNLAPYFDKDSNLSPVDLHSSPYNFKTSYLFNRNSVLSDFCIKILIVTKPI